MKTIRIILWTLLGLVLACLVASLVLVRHISYRAIPDYNATIPMEGLQGKVQVLRDTFGIPHIFAENEADLYLVTGYVMAQDRLWQMDLLRRVAQGRLSEIFGEGMIGTDQLFRALRIEDKSNLIMVRTEPEIMACIRAFSEGVNRYIEDAGRDLPFEFSLLHYKPEPWLPLHTVNLIGYMSWSSSSSWGNETTLYRISRLVGEEKTSELIPDPDLQTPIFPDFVPMKDSRSGPDMQRASEVIRELGLQVFMGSNNWAVSGRRSFNGVPIVCNDMHLQLNIAPGIWYQMHQVIPGKLNVSGIVLPGTPFINVGHNDSIAWGMTYVSVDDIDFYLETINPSDTNQYLLDGKWMDMETRVETFRVKGGERVTRINRFTHRGPVISYFRGIGDRVVSMRWTGNDYSNEIRTAYLLDRARNIHDFAEALRTWTTISTNSVCGDAAGNIALYVAAEVPLCPGNRSLMMPGDTSLYDWTGYVPFEQLPHGVNPPEGFLASANNRSAGPDYPYYISSWYAVPGRYDRILEMISEQEVFSMDDMMRMQADQKSAWAGKVMRVCNPVLNAADITGGYLAAYDRIHAWDGTMNPDAVQASLFEVFYRKLAESVFLDELGEESYRLLAGGTIEEGVMDRILEGQEISWCDDVSTPDTSESFRDLVVPAWKEAVDWLAENYGPDMETWKWGDLHTLTMKHALASVKFLNRVFRLERGPYRAGGADHTVCAYTWSALNPFAVTNGASQRHVYNLLDPDDSRIIMPTGVSGIPASNFFCNQSDRYMKNQYLSESFTREKVERNAPYLETFIPR
jgi:penicillin amidase